MNSILHEPSTPGPRVPLHPKARALAGSAGAAIVAAGLSFWEFLKIACNLSAELNRIADEWEATRPEQAARMREVARKGWDW